MRRWGIAGILALGGLLLAGCTDVVTGQASSDPGAVQRYLAENGPISSASGLGDPTNIDYCSLMDKKGAGPGIGSGDLQPSFDYCDLLLKIDGQDAYTVVGYLADKSDPVVADLKEVQGRKLPHSLVQEEQPGGQSPVTNCTYYLDFSDGVTLEFDTGLKDATGAPQKDLCAVTSASVDVAVAAIVGKKVTHLDFSGKPLGKLDACSVLTDDFVGPQLGVPAEKTSKPSKHYCYWGETGGAGVSVAFATYAPYAGEAGTTQEQLGNRTSTVVPSGTEDCSVETVLGPGLVTTDGSQQMARLSARGFKDKDPCAIARTLVSQAWTKLPAAS